MDFIEHEETQRRVDYSFGDHSGVLGHVPNAYMKKANMQNQEFVSFMGDKVNKVVSLFIDNIRLYKRPLQYSDWMHRKPITPQDREWLAQFDDEDLLALCAEFPKTKFIIFTAFEDTPLDTYILGDILHEPIWLNPFEDYVVRKDHPDVIPKNVIAIHAVNAVLYGGKIHPFPHGIERIMYPGYNHHALLKEAMASPLPSPTRPLLLVCHREDTGDRGGLRPLFKEKTWATVAPHLEYPEYLKAIQNHKFVLCPSGNGIESARNWETLYLRRVPVLQDFPYLREMFKNFPALFVHDFSKLTERDLNNFDYLFDRAKDMDINKLTLSYWFNKAYEQSL